MTKGLLIITALLFPVALLSQTIFQDISFQQAVQRSTETGKLIFLQFESLACNRCNEVANKAFEDKALSDQLEQTFVCLKITPSHPDRETIGSLYNVNAKEGFGSFFIDQNKTLLHSFHRTTTRAADYKEQIDLAMYKAGEETRLNELEKEYANGNKSIAVIQLILQKRKSLSLETGPLLDEYVSLLPQDSLSSMHTLVFIAQMAPVLDSKADVQLRKNYELFNVSWYSMTLPVRIEINNRIIIKSLNKAIREKDEAFAYRVATFARSIHSGNSKAGNQAFEYDMIKYYKETNDTGNYLIRAIYFYDNYYMSVSVDSIKRMDSLNQRSGFERQNASVNKKDTGSFRQRQVAQFAYAPLTQNFTRELNMGAWNIYKMTKDPLHINKALQWAKRANEFYETPEAMDTYARLLYQTGNRKEAISWEEKAIALQKKRGFPIKELVAVMGRMSQHKEKIDD